MLDMKPRIRPKGSVPPRPNTSRDLDATIEHTDNEVRRIKYSLVSVSNMVLLIMLGLGVSSGFTIYKLFEISHQLDTLPIHRIHVIEDLNNED